MLNYVWIRIFVIFVHCVNYIEIKNLVHCLNKNKENLYITFCCKYYKFVYIIHLSYLYFLLKAQFLIKMTLASVKNIDTYVFTTYVNFFYFYYYFIILFDCLLLSDKITILELKTLCAATIIKKNCLNEFEQLYMNF